MILDVVILSDINSDLNGIHYTIKNKFKSLSKIETEKSFHSFIKLLSGSLIDDFFRFKVQMWQGIKPKMACLSHFLKKNILLFNEFKG